MTKRFQYTDIDGILKEAEAYISGDFISIGSGAVDAAKPVITNASGVIDTSLLPASLNAKAASLVVDRIASEDILRGDFVCATTINHVGLAAQDTTIDKALVMGAALNDANSGENVEVLLIGVLSDALFSGFSVNDLLFLDTDGAITNTKPTNKYLTIVGRALGNNEILIFIQQPTVLG